MRIISEEILAIVTIHQEAAGESYLGKLAVAEVIRNRMNKRYASDGTVTDTVLRPKQFSEWNTGDAGRIRNARIDSDDSVVKDCIRAWHEAQAGSNTVHGAVLYYAPSTLKKLQRINTIAEGVETEAELELLKNMGCEEYSGHLLAEAGTSGEFERRWLRPENVFALRPRR